MKQTIDFENKPELILQMQFREPELSDEEMRSLLDGGETEIPDHARRLIEGVATVATLDDNDVEVLPEALRAAEKDLLNRPTILENHRFDRPIGRVLESRFDPSDNSLRIKGFVSSVENDVWRKITEGVLSKFSISWRSVDVERIFDEDLQREKFVVKDMRIFEVSVISVPALVNADITGVVERALKDGKNVVLNRAAPYDEPFITPFRRDPAAPRDRRWDAASAVRRLRRRAGGTKDKIDWARYAQGFAYVQVDGTKFGDYKFPIRDVSNGRLVSVFKAISSAASRLPNSKIPDEDKRDIAKRLVKEYREIHNVEEENIPETLLELAG